MELSLRSVMTTSDFYVTLEYFAKSSGLGTILLGVFAVIFQVDTFGEVAKSERDSKGFNNLRSHPHFQSHPLVLPQAIYTVC